MRFFPRTARRRWAAAVAVCAVAAGALTAPIANAEDLKGKQKKVQKQIDHAHEDLEHSSDAARRAIARLETARANLAEARDQLGLVRGRLHAARIRDLLMQERLAAAVARLEVAEADLAAGRVAVDEQREVVTNTIVSIYQGADSDLVAFSSFLEAQSTEELTRQAELEDVMVGRQTRAYDDLRAAEVLLEVREAQVQEARDEVAVQRREAAEHLITMQDLRDQAVRAKARVWETVHERRDATQAAKLAKARDARELQKLRREEQRIKQLILAEARKAARNNSGGGFRGATGGFLSKPVNGYVTSPFGYRTHPIYGYYALHDGTDFGAGCGQPLYAAAGGKVISRYYSSSYGNRLHIGVGMVNGKYLTIVYNHATGYRVGVGQTVGRGEVVGYVGSTGWSTGCHLHFTVLANGQAVNPFNYM